MEKISAVIITLNEEDNIKDCLKSISWVDEIIVCDAFSKDKTIEICKEYGAKVYQNYWLGHSEQKNYANSKTSFDWILSLDADERLSSELINELRDIRSGSMNKCNGYLIPRCTYYLGCWINHSNWYPNYQLRLFNKKFARWTGKVHECINLEGKTKYLKSDILHYSYKDLNHHLYKVASSTSLMAMDMYENGIRFRLLNLIITPIDKFITMYFLKLGLLDGIQGFILAVVSSFYRFMQHAKLFEVELSDKKQ